MTTSAGCTWCGGGDHVARFATGCPKHPNFRRLESDYVDHLGILMPGQVCHVCGRTDPHAVAGPACQEAAGCPHDIAWGFRKPGVTEPRQLELFASASAGPA